VFQSSFEIKYLFELSSFTDTSYCETAHRSTLVFFFFGVLSLPNIHYYFTFNESWILLSITLFSHYFPIYV
jgi:hypothetical protein